MGYDRINGKKIFSYQTQQGSLSSGIGSGFSNNYGRVFFSIKQTKMYILQVRYIFSKHNLEKANGMDGWKNI